MTVLFKCDACSTTVEVEDLEDEAIRPPKGWRNIRSVIEEYVDQSGHFNEYVTENSHRCADCNDGLSVDNHLAFELANRLKGMREAKP